MDAYRVLNKTESRNVYNAKIFINPPDPNSPPYNYGYERTRRYNAGQYYRLFYFVIFIFIYYASFHIKATTLFLSRDTVRGQPNPFSSHGPFDSTNKEHYDAWSTNPFLSFNRKRAYGIVFGLMVLNFLFLR